jgi:competence protein ComEC
MIGETLFAQILVLPLLIYYFGQISLISIIANILIVPIIPLAMAWGSITALIFPWRIVTYPLVILIQSVLSMNQYLASLSWASITVPNIKGYMLILIYVIMGIGYWIYIKQKKI